MCGESLDHRPSVLEVVGVISLHLPQVDVEGHMHVDGSIGGSEEGSRCDMLVRQPRFTWVGRTIDEVSPSASDQSMVGWWDHLHWHTFFSGLNPNKRAMVYFRWQWRRWNSMVE